MQCIKHLILSLSSSFWEGRFEFLLFGEKIQDSSSPATYCNCILNPQAFTAFQTPTWQTPEEEMCLWSPCDISKFRLTLETCNQCLHKHHTCSLGWLLTYFTFSCLDVLFQPQAIHFSPLMKHTLQCNYSQKHATHANTTRLHLSRNHW